MPQMARNLVCKPRDTRPGTLSASGYASTQLPPSALFVHCLKNVVLSIEGKKENKWERMRTEDFISWAK